MVESQVLKAQIVPCIEAQPQLASHTRRLHIGRNGRLTVG